VEFFGYVKEPQVNPHTPHDSKHRKSKPTNPLSQVSLVRLAALRHSPPSCHPDVILLDSWKLENKKAQEAIVNLPPTVKSVINAN
jgi:hypothetical protein